MATPKKASKRRLPGKAVLPKDLLREVPGARVVEYKAGAHIFREGDAAPNCYVVTVGKVRVLKRNQQGRDISLAVLKPGEFLGEMAMLSSEKRCASAVALTRVKAIVIAHADFVDLVMAEHPFAAQLSLHLSTLLAARCHHMLRLLARHHDNGKAGPKVAPALDVRPVLDRFYTRWAV